MTAPVYLDHNATTPILPEVVQAMLPFLTEHFGNPSSAHAYGQRAAAAVHRARAQVAELLGAEPDEIVFTGCGTEASNLAILGMARALGEGVPRRVVTSAIEHPATLAPTASLVEAGWQRALLPVQADGRVDLRAAAEVLSEPTALLSIMHANNETGVLQPVAALANLARQAGALVHSDAAQSIGKVPVDVGALDVDLLTLAGHKLYAPKGIGALYVRRGTPIAPVIRGAGHERGLRPGTENVPYIVGLGAACAAAARDLHTEAERIAALRDRLLALLRSKVPEVVVHGEASPRLPNTLNLRFPGVRGAEILTSTPAVAASTGSACHEGVWQASRVLLAMGIAADEALGAVRLSLGRSTDDDDVSRAAAALAKAWAQLTEDRK